MIGSNKINLPTKYWNFEMYQFWEWEDFYLKKDFTNIPFVRIHSECVSWDCLWSLLCDCWEQLHESLKLIKRYWGMLFYLRQEWRWHWLQKKIKAVSLEQTQTLNTIQAFNELWLEIDVRDYSEVWELLLWMWIREIKLITNNPKKIKSMESLWIAVQRHIIASYVNEFNSSYLHTKIQYLWHDICLHNGWSEIIYFYEPYDKNWWLANFSEHIILINWVKYRTVEHYYQSQKFKWTKIEQIIIDSETPNIAKELSRVYNDKVINNWNQIKDYIMRTGNIAKFEQHINLLKLLKETWDAIIVENAENDYYWWCGADRTWLNKMWYMLMDIRNFLILTI